MQAKLTTSTNNNLVYVKSAAKKFIRFNYLRRVESIRPGHVITSAAGIILLLFFPLLTSVAQHGTNEMASLSGENSQGLTEANEGAGIITGTINTPGSEPLMGANVMLRGTSMGAATNENGDFSIDSVPTGYYELVVSYIGFRTVSRRIRVEQGRHLEFEFMLEPYQYMPQIEVLGRRPDSFERIPGSVGIISREIISVTAPVSGHEVFRKISGIHAVEEEGVGLRANIGIRGLDPNKSRNVLMMEDGIPIALAPYGEPEMYYTPSMDRMEGLEVIKGSGSILYGPQTFGGVVNYITADPPVKPTATFHLRGGQGGYFVSRTGYGNSIGETGYQFDYLRRQGDEVGLLNFELNDLNARIRLSTGENSFAGIKLGYYDETSNSTYVGLSQPMFDRGLHDHVHLAPDDVLNIRRYSGSLIHDIFFSEDVSLKTTVFGYTTARNWSRQEFDNNPVQGREYDRIVGDQDSEFGALYFRDATGNRNRQFEVFGIEPRFSANFRFSGIDNELDAGVRYLFERAYEQRINGTMAAPASGVLRDDEIRTGYAVSAYVQNRIYLGSSLSVTPGLRMENFRYDRKINLLNFEEFGTVTRDHLTEFIPGAGINYRFENGSSIFAGVHRGFGPPRIKDAISAAGQSEELEAERSWNYEIGSRTRLGGGVHFELTGFLLDFTNQIIPVAESAGGIGLPGAGGLVNGGATRHTGIESSVTIEYPDFPAAGYDLYFMGSATLLRAFFSDDRFVTDAGGELVNVRNNELPYAPSQLFSGYLSMASPFGISFGFNTTWTGDQYTDALNTTKGSGDGRSGLIGGYFLMDSNVSWKLPYLDNASVSLSVKNLLNERYIMSRRPQGIRVGLPRFISAGFDLTF